MVALILQYFKLGEYSSGTASFPNVITVYRITVQMNVNSSTIIVQVRCGHCHNTSSNPFTLPAIAVSPLLFLYSRLFSLLDSSAQWIFCRSHKYESSAHRRRVTTGRQPFQMSFSDDVTLWQPLELAPVPCSRPSPLVEHSMQSAAASRFIEGRV